MPSPSTIRLLPTLALLSFLSAPAGSEDAGPTSVATFAGGCFWCVESDFDQVPGVVRTISGFTGGTVANPTYRQVTAGGTGHREAVEIHFDPAKVGYAALLEIFWRSVDPTDGGGQFCDRGESYQTAIFVHSPEQRRLAEASKKALQDAKVLTAPIVTPIEDSGPFTPAEDYHQNFYKKSPVRYNLYRFRCGRNARVESLWGTDAYRGIAAHNTKER